VFIYLSHAEIKCIETGVPNNSILPFPHTIHLYQTLPTFPNSHLRNCMATFA